MLLHEKLILIVTFTQQCVYQEIKKNSGSVWLQYL